MAELLFGSKALVDFFTALNAFCIENPTQLMFLMFVLGTCVGSFLNVVALRSLKEESLIWPASYCPSCNHSLAPWDNVPIISYISLNGRCRYCRKRISWQYPVVELCTGLLYAAIAYIFMIKQIPLANFDAIQSSPAASDFTHDLFLAIQNGKGMLSSTQMLGSNDLIFYKYGLVLGCIVFTSTLVAVIITDFREKLIPHEITYPSMLFGIAFSALVRGDLLGALAGIGASYIIFDFMAFYGLKLYMRMKPEEFEKDSNERDEHTDHSIDDAFDIAQPAAEEDIEVMGGGDAVLSAVMSAYLGWQGLVLALIVGFISGAIMGLAYLAVEMKRAGILKECGQKALIMSIGMAVVMGTLAFLAMSSLGMPHDELIKMTMSFSAMSAVAGALIGMIMVGTRVSKPFPFGPALALGGFVAMFLIPYYLPFYK